MMIHLADVAEHQGVIDWVAYGRAYGAVIVRAHNGGRPDVRWDANRDGARANVRVRGWYQYLQAGRDAKVQAAGFCNTVGDLRAGEFAVVDIEEGTGDQAARAREWMEYVDGRLGGRAWLYTGEAFAREHFSGLVGFTDRNVWVANYRSRPPGVRYTLWQHTDREPHAGIRNPGDCSIFNGTLDQFAALTRPEVPPMYDPPLPPTCASQKDPVAGGVWLLSPTGAVEAIEGARFFGAPFGKSYWVGHTAARFALPEEFSEAERAAGKQYVVLDDHGNHYAYPE